MSSASHAFTTAAGVRLDPEASRKWANAFQKTLKEGPHRMMFEVKRVLPTALSRLSADAPVASGGSFTRTGTFAGAWSDNKRNGMGTQTLKDGSRYEGSWVNDRREGVGSLFLKRKGASGSNSLFLSYRGEWVNNERQGRGKQWFENGDVYDGDWVSGKRAGRGSMVYADGSRYAGMWSANVRSGHGVLVLPNGDAYDGAWEADEKHGEGRYIYAERRTILRGEWVRGGLRTGEMSAADSSMDALVASLLADAPSGATPTRLPELGLADPRSVLAEATAAARLGARGGGATRGTASSGFTGFSEDFGAPETDAASEMTSRPVSMGTQSIVASGLIDLSAPPWSELDLDASDFQRIIAAFDAADQTGSGFLSADKSTVYVALSRFGLEPDEADLENILRRLVDVQLEQDETAEGISILTFARVLAEMRE